MFKAILAGTEGKTVRPSLGGGKVDARILQEIQGASEALARWSKGPLTEFVEQQQRFNSGSRELAERLVRDCSFPMATQQIGKMLADWPQLHRPMSLEVSEAVKAIAAMLEQSHASSVVSGVERSGIRLSPQMQLDTTRWLGRMSLAEGAIQSVRATADALAAAGRLDGRHLLMGGVLGSAAFDDLGPGGIPVLTGFSALTRSYERMFERLAQTDDALLSTPSYVFELPPVDIRLKAGIIDSFDGEYEDSDGRDILADPAYSFADVEAMLAERDPKLRAMLHEALDAARSNAVGKVRHVSVSLRELCTHVLHELAPDREIHRWQPDRATNRVYDSRKPTRFGRIGYICRFVNFGPYGRHLSRSMDTTIAFFDLLHEGTHARRCEISDTQLEMMIRDAVGILRFLLTTAQDTE